MATYHLHLKIVKRSGGQRVTHAAAYRSGTQITDIRSAKTFDYTRKGDIEHTEILAPSGAPDWVYDRSALWNKTEQIDKRKDSQLAREVEISLPRELSPEQCVALVRAFVRDQFTSKGMIADVAIHRPDASDGLPNPHAHVLLTMRRVNAYGTNFDGKAREWNPAFTTKEKKQLVGNKAPILSLRQKWEVYANAALEDAGSNERIDHRSYEDRGIKREKEPVLGAANHSNTPAAAARKDARNNARWFNRQMNHRTAAARRAKGGYQNPAEEQALAEINARKFYQMNEAAKRALVYEGPLHDPPDGPEIER